MALIATLAQDPAYETSADVLVNRQEAATTSVIGQTPALDDADRTMETQVLLADVPEIRERAVRAAGLPGVSATALQTKSSVFALGDILRFVVSDADPARAELLASAYAREYVRYRRALDTSGLRATLAQVRRRIARLESSGDVDSPLYLRSVDHEQQLESLAALRTSNVSVVRAADSDATEQVAPRPRRNAALALGAGLVLGLVLVFLWETLTTRPRSKEELESLVGMPFLARLGRRGSSLGGRPGTNTDAVHTLRTNMELAVAAVGARTVMVASAGSEEGTTSTTAELAVALARTGRHVALIDLDLRRRGLTRLLGLEDGRGIGDVVRGECTLADAVVSIPLDDEAEPAAPATTNGRRSLAGLLDAVGAGTVGGQPAEISGSSAITAVLTELERRADLVLVTAPPLLEAPDAGSIAMRVDAVLLVVSDRAARGPTLAEARRVVDGWPAARLGFALTDGEGDAPSVSDLRRGVAPASLRVGEQEHVS